MPAFKTLSLLAAILSGTALAEPNQEIHFSSGPQQVHLLELFTSQGCSSCPPADTWLSQLKQDPRLWKNLVPVAFHVDYWDGLGWRDRFADPRFSNRQRQYQQAGNVGSVYTPGFVVAGKEWRGWFRRSELPLQQKSAGQLTGTISGSRLMAQYRDANAQPELIGHVAILGFDLQTPVKAGENSRKTLHEDFVVLWHHSATVRNGEWEMELPPHTEFETQQLGIALWVHSRNSPTPLQATGGWF